MTGTEKAVEHHTVYLIAKALPPAPFSNRALIKTLLQPYGSKLQSPI